MIVARAPGRLDVMGGIADYSGSLVLQLPLDRCTTAFLTPATGSRATIISASATGSRSVAIDLQRIAAQEPEEIAWAFPAGGDKHWASYVVGVIKALLKRALNERRGFLLEISSSVPEGKGVSSSAALEVACHGAVARHFGVALSPREIALDCQWAENRIAGAPCGVMDQMTSVGGQANQLLRLLCQPATIQESIVLPRNMRFFGIDSGIRHAVTGADYATVRTAAFMGYRMIADMAELPSRQSGDRMIVDDEQWNGYLANISPFEFESRFAHRLPERLEGAEFLEYFGGITDTVTQVDPARTYPVRIATAHPIYENARVHQFAEFIESGIDREHDLGALMLESHASYSACGLGHEATDLLVELALDHGFKGAKITGGGSGGTVAVLARGDDLSQLQLVAQAYGRVTGRHAELFTASGSGLSVTEV